MHPMPNALLIKISYDHCTILLVFICVMITMCLCVGSRLLLVSQIELDMVSLLVHCPGLLEYVMPNYTDYNYYKHGAHGPKNNIYRLQGIVIGQILSHI
jgi:hypothetical protein